MILLYFVLGLCSLTLCGVWIGTIFYDNALGYKVQVRQYVLTILCLLTGLSQFYMIYFDYVLS